MRNATAYVQFIYQFVEQMKSSIFLHVMQDAALFLMERMEWYFHAQEYKISHVSLGFKGVDEDSVLTITITIG